MDKWEKEHRDKVNRIAKQIEGIHNTAIKEAAAIGASIGGFDSSRPFTFAAYPQTKALVDKLLKRYQKGVEVAIVNGIKSSWALSNNKNNELVYHVFGDNINRLSKAQLNKYFSNNDQARDAFAERKEGGLNLSDRVWKYTEQFKDEIELGIDCGLRDRLSAHDMSRELKEYLQFPDKLFRRVRDDNGFLHLSKKAKAFRPGQGVYRSSKKNALRLARSETNMAYRTSDFDRWAHLDFVVGVEIKLSNNHTVADVCDVLAGKYPKGFRFTGWHPQCFCYVIPILATSKEMGTIIEKLLNEEELGDFRSKNEVKDVPTTFKDWVCDNKDRIERAKSKPYFVLQNPNYVEKARYMSVERLNDAHKFMLADEYYKYKSDEAGLWMAKNRTDLHISHVTSIRDYSGNGFASVNEYLRKGVKSNRSIEFIETYTRVLNDALDRCPHRYSGMVYRGTPLTEKQVEKYRIGYEKQVPVLEDAFFSSSRDPEEMFSGNVQFTVEVENQAEITEMSSIANEKEVLLKAGSRFQVTSYREEHGITQIAMKLIR